MVLSRLLMAAVSRSRPVQAAAARNFGGSSKPSKVMGVPDPIPVWKVRPRVRSKSAASPGDAHNEGRDWSPDVSGGPRTSPFPRAAPHQFITARLF